MMMNSTQNSKRKLSELSPNCSKIMTNKKHVSFSYNVSLFTFIKANLETNLSENQTDAEQDDPMGYFGLLPEEILIQIFRLLTIEELSVMALTNNKIRDFIIEHFIMSNSGFIFTIRASKVPFDASDVEQHSTLYKLFTSLGLLLKRCTFLFRTTERISLLIHILESSFGIPSIKNIMNCDYFFFKIIFKCYGRLINKLIAGWGDFECEHVYQELKERMQIDAHIDKFLTGSLGSRYKQELMIRNFFRMICSNHQESMDYFKEKLSWIIKTFKSFSTGQIAKLFIVIFGPLVTINNSFHTLPYIAWWDLTDSFFNQKGFEDLGLTFYFLYKQSNDLSWNKEFLINLFKTIIDTPATWSNSNIAALFYYSGYELTLKYLNKMMQEDRVMEVGVYLCYLNIITYRNTQDLSQIMRLLEYLTEEYGNELTEEFVLAFSWVIYDLDLFDEGEIGDRWEASEVIESQLELMKLVLLKINQMKKYI